MNIFEMAKIPLNRAIEAMQLDEGAAKIIAIVASTAPFSVLLRVVCVIIKM